ncbi:MAG: transposase [Clostridia bacterium]|nr:transposase [Clostridia bacterium]
MANNETFDKLRLLFLITSQKMTNKIGDLFSANSVPIHYRVWAMGTATSEVLDILGLGTQEKRLFLSVLPKDTADAMLLKIHKALKIGTVNSGIAYTVPISGASKVAFRMLDGLNTDIQSTKKENTSMNEKNNAMIVAVINRGYSEEVMDAARKAGAGGGTVLNSRSVVEKEAISHLGANFSEEKEIVLIVANAETKLPIMQAISENCGIQSEAKGIVYSLPIDNVIGLSD